MKPLLLLCCFFIFLTIKANAQKINTDSTIKKTSDTTKSSDTTYIPQKYRDIHKRSPVLACVLSLYIPGAGQVYNKQVAKGIALFGILTVSFGAAEVYHANNVTHPHDGVTVALLVPFFASFVYSAIDAPITASYLNRTYHLGKKKKEFTSLHISPDLINAGTSNRFDAGISLIWR